MSETITLSQHTQILQLYLQEHPNLENISGEEIQYLYQKLIDCLIDHNHLYYGESAPIISDSEYDQLFDYLKKIEEHFPSLISSNSPTQNLIGQISEGFIKHDHRVRLLSLENSYNAEDIFKFDERLKKLFQKSGIAQRSYGVEPKFDGISVELIYKNGKLHQAITRGDGISGDDITINVKTIRNIPHTLKSPDAQQLFTQPIPSLLSVRGEIMLPKSVLKKLNDEKEKSGQDPFANTRNAASGSMKLLDSGEVAKRGLVCYVYDILYTDDKTSSETLDLQTLGLPVFPWKKECKTIEEVIHLALDTKTKEYLENQDVDFDGLVVKLKNDLIPNPDQTTGEFTSLRELIGQTTHHPRRAIAYKFPAQQISTQIVSVDFQIGRTGIITPVANLAPVSLSGVTISRVSLHNFDFINEKDIQKGDFVRIQRSGEVIPYILSVIKDRREHTFPILPPKKCPSCESPIQQQDMHYYCKNPDCPAIFKEKLKYFVSKECMDIEGMGESLIDLLVDKGYVMKMSDVYLLADVSSDQLGKQLSFDAKKSNLRYELMRNAGIGEKKLTEISNSLQKSKSNPLRRILNGLSIPHLGKKLSQDFQKYLADMWSLSEEGFFTDVASSPVDHLIALLSSPVFYEAKYGIGPEISNDVLAFFSSSRNQEILRELEKIGLNFSPLAPTTKPSYISDQFLGKHFAITGTFPLPRQKMISLFEERGATFDSNPTKKTDFMLIGADAGSKKTKAEELGVFCYEGREKLLSEFPFLSSIPTTDFSQPKKVEQQGFF